MEERNSYLAYKRDTTYLIYWMVHASNRIIQSSPSLPTSGSAPTTVNSTGKITVSALVPLSKLIAQYISPIPSTVYHLFQSVIAARTATHELFQQIAAKTPDPEIEKSNASHKRFIDALTEAFEALGGSTWASKQKSAADNIEEEDVDEIIFTNQFSVLGLDGSNDGEGANDVADGGSDEPSVSALPVRHKKKPVKKGKKGKRGTRAKGKSKSTVKEVGLEEVPLESYRIIEDESGLVTDYLMAVYSLITQWVELRHYVQGLWREVSYNGLNSAVAGTLSNVATAMVKQFESTIFIDFPGHESYEIVMKTITRGDPEKAQGMFHMNQYKMGPGGEIVEKGPQVDVDIKEEFLMHAYWDLVDFITDFQKTRSGRPTKPMLSTIRNWDPKLDLQRASKEKRIKWRRAYTINWLYDLVNLFSSIVVQRITLKGQQIVLETVDWSINGPWNVHRRLFGLNEFAGDITSLAMQKPGTDIRQKILPHHIFQLQCIVDSLTVSRGWSVNSLKGHIMSPPAPGFRPRRDVDLFMDRENERLGHGYCQGVDILTQFFDKDAMLNGDPNRHQRQSELLKLLRDDFVDFLGESKYMHGLKTIPPSRFSNTDSNGLWEYSPFLCGVGLMESLELAYHMNFWIWDGMPEPMCLIHLHNMLVQKGYINQPIGLYASLQSLLSTTFFVDGKIPTSDFERAFSAICGEAGSRRAKFQRQAFRRNISRTAVDIHGMLSSNMNRFFKQKSFLGLYREANWIPERIPDEEVPVASGLGAMRLAETKHTVDPETGNKVLENTALVSRARALGMDDRMIMKMSLLQQTSGVDGMLPEALLASLPEGYHTNSLPSRGHKRDGNFTNRQLLDILKLDLVGDVSGHAPFSSINYVWVTVRMMGLFHQIEDELKRLRNPLWVLAYEEDPLMMREKRASLTGLVLANEDDQCMEVMAKAFQDPRTGLMQHIYWEDLDDLGKAKKSTASEGYDEVADSCVVM